MKVVYQGVEEETTSSTLAAYLSAKGVDASKAIVECGSEIYAPGSDVSGVALSDGLSINVFKVVAGG